MTDTEVFTTNLEDVLNKILVKVKKKYTAL